MFGKRKYFSLFQSDGTDIEPTQPHIRRVPETHFLRGKAAAA
jgi:hypothetical protein